MSDGRAGVKIPKSQLNRYVLLGSLVFASLLVASHWFFVENVHHRVFGVAWNALFQIFGNGAGAFAALVIGIGTVGRGISWRVGIPATLLLGGIAGYCFLRSFGMMMSI